MLANFGKINNSTSTNVFNLPKRVIPRYKSKIAGIRQLKFINKTVEGVTVQISELNPETGFTENGQSTYVHFHWDGTVYPEIEAFSHILRAYGFVVVNEKRPSTIEEMRQFLYGNNKD